MMMLKVLCTPYESNEERLLGLKLNLEEDDLIPHIHLNLYGKHRGDYQGETGNLR